ncbi:MAG TPA: ABC transporter permease [Clostridiales bacterium]|nr:ABC transporter permease [Clostridiales bacterium]
MNIFKRACLYIVRKWKKSILIFGVVFAVASLVISGLAILDAQETQSAELRGTTGTSFTVSRNTSTGGWGNGKGGSYSTQEFLSNEMLKNIGGIEGVEGYNASVKSILCLSDSNGNFLEQLNPIGHAEVDCMFYSFGCINSEYHSLFLSGALEMCDGSTIDTDISNGVVISKDIADKHKLKVGDTIQAVNDPYSGDKTLNLKIIGLFDIIADKTDEKNNYDEASYYDYANYAFISECAMKEMLSNYADVGYASADFFVNDPQKLETIIQEAQNISSINWNNFVVTANDEVYERTASSMSNVSTLIISLIVIVVIISIGIITLILLMWMKSRKKEIGILLSIGESKPAILLQYLLETILISIVAFPCSYWFSTLIAGKLGGLFGKDIQSIAVSIQHFEIVSIVGIVILCIAVLISCLPMMRFNPKEILSQME